MQLDDAESGHHLCGTIMIVCAFLLGTLVAGRAAKVAPRNEQGQTTGFHVMESISKPRIHPLSDTSVVHRVPNPVRLVHLPACS